MKDNEISVTFHADKAIIEKLDKASKLKAASMGLGVITRKQAFNLAIKEAVERWGKEPKIE
ncbi:MAG: hypothetical protein WCP85_03350 [Mariniphaga sp.]